MLNLRRWPVCLAAAILVLMSAALCAANPNGDPADTLEIKVTARRFTFSPKQITVRKGQTVRLVVTSEDVDHGIAIDEFNIDKAIKAHKTEIIEFTPATEGKFRIYCSVFCGAAHPDMEGELIVTNDAAGNDSSMQVSFESEPGVVVVESNGERIRIDTNKKTVTRLSEAQRTNEQESAASQEDRAPAVKGESRRAAEPYDYRLVNLPTPKRVERGSLNLYFSHRFSEPINDEGAEDLFGLDGVSVSSFGLQYGITDRLYANFHRSPICQTGICKTIEVGLGYHILDEAGRSPLALSAYASIEGEDNFTEEYTYNLQAMMARSVTSRLNLFFSPAVHINSNGQGRFNARATDFFPPEPLADEFRLGRHTGSFGFGANARLNATTSVVFEYTPRVGFKLGRIEAQRDAETGEITAFENDSQPAIGFGIEKRIGRHAFSLTFSNTQATTTSRYNSSNLALPRSKFLIGFNLFRRLL